MKIRRNPAPGFNILVPYIVSFYNTNKTNGTLLLIVFGTSLFYEFTSVKLLTDVNLFYEIGVLLNTL